jgi:hypothetical protein
MSKIHLLDNLLKQYKQWTLNLKNASDDIENNLLQKDSSNKIEEKLASIGISMVFVYIVTAIIGLFGVAIGGVWSVVFFVIGWVLSKLINKKIFGSERKIEDLKDDERELLNKLEQVIQTHVDIRSKINDKSIIVNFTKYPKLKSEFEAVVNALSTLNTSSLALKYRYKYPLVVKKYQAQVRRFDEIYANKRGR